MTIPRSGKPASARRITSGSEAGVPKQIDKVVGILVFTANPEGKRLEDHERTRAADADVSGGGLPEDGLAAQGHDLVVLECQMQPRSDNRRPIVRQ
jgi:hypothetical protein